MTAPTSAAPYVDDATPPIPTPATSGLSSARAAAIDSLLAEGYQAESGERRRVRTIDHALFLHRAGTIQLPD